VISDRANRNALPLYAGDQMRLDRETAMKAVTIRKGVQRDVPSILGIYNEVIASSTAIYADDPVSLDNRMAWFAQQEERGFPVLVAIAPQGDVIGFSAFADWRGAWPGYRHTVEHSVHVRAGRRGAGVGRHLVEALFPYAHALGKHVMIGGIDAANSASIRLHERLGFQHVAHFHEVGRKFDRWLDLVFMERVLDAM
jgi:phosphinothricin acetyltransferase